MRQTERYGFHLLDGEDRISPKPLNENMARMEQALIDSADAAGKALLRAVGVGGHNARIAFGSYVGNGRSGSSAKNSLAFDFRPVFVQIAGEGRRGFPPFIRGCGQTAVHIFDADARDLYITAVWEERGLHWYSTDYASPAYAQMNENGRTYYWAAIGYDDAENEG